MADPSAAETTRLLAHEPSSDASSETSSLVSTSTGTLSLENDSSHQQQRREYGTCSSQAVISDEEANKPNEQAAIKPPEQQKYSNAFIARVVISLLIGQFTSNADASLVMATHSVIASEFYDFEDSSWLFISFMLAAVATQSIYGKLSDIYGRKIILLICFGLFAGGCALIGVGQSLSQVILGRVISGSGASGFGVLCALIITDLAPLRDVASWNSYMNVISTLGRSLGGPIGGWLADTVGWRWSFLGQTPIFAVAMLLCYIVLPPLTSTPTTANHEEGTELKDSRLARVDFLGAFLLGAGVLALLLPIEIGGQKVAWTHPLIYVSFAIGTVLLILFVLTESYVAREPIFPLRLLRNRDLVLCYLINCFQGAAQLSMMFSVPLYFQVAGRSSNTVAGAHLFPAVVGNAVGGILSGIWIHRTGCYKALLIFAGASAILSYALLILRWNGDTNWAESLYIVPGGFGTGISMSAVFVALQASIDPSDRAVAASGLFLVMPVGAIIGMALSSAAMLSVLRRTLIPRLVELGLNGLQISEVVKQAVARVDYLDEAPPRVAKAVVESYIDGLEYSHGM
ncbi:putative multidrug resistance protein [Eutypa lata UCREL1]|uniref:Putative multidrug resistance protein n=1 Tax=Eutypa lata (strain UCR-EL1) TaxID=1287681 RepID=M7SZ12_EUTLA|nr:putative multidrug resistance protein [Eutypa lata UCREL1]